MKFLFLVGNLFILLMSCLAYKPCEFKAEIKDRQMDTEYTVKSTLSTTFQSIYYDPFGEQQLEYEFTN